MLFTLPYVPDSIHYYSLSGTHSSIPIEEITPDVLLDIAERWKSELLAKAQFLKNSNKTKDSEYRMWLVSNYI